MRAIDLLGYVGSGLMMLCLAPQLIKTLRDGHADGFALGYLVMAVIGMACLLVFVLFTGAPIPLVVNYLVNGIAFGVILKYKLAPVVKR